MKEAGGPGAPLYSPEWIRRRLSETGKTIRKSLGQHYLVNPGVVDQIAQACAARDKACVEIGSGMGVLTRGLLLRGMSVVAVETEKASVDILGEVLVPEFGEKIRVAHRNFMDATGAELFDPLGGRALLCGNLPYNLTSEILMRSLEVHRSRTSALVYMMQREVATRLLSPPGNRDYGILTVFLSAFYKISRVCRVAPGSFMPPPRVDSEVLAFDPVVPAPEFANWALFKSVVRAAFNQRRKMLGVALRQSPLLVGGPPVLESLLGADPKLLQKRAEELHWRDFQSLAQRALEKMP